jgi:hypothetical protein
VGVCRYQVVEYNKDNLIGLLVKGSYGARNAKIASKPQIDYFHGYCVRLEVRFIVYEEQYVDRYFSDDYSGYYAKSFPRYPRICKRMHFFSAPITQEIFEQLLSGSSELYKDPQSNDLGYCGFIVVKPLPQTVIGRTCLKAVGVSTQEAFFPPMSRCAANLFGMNLAVESLPFQEQDREVAACATSALWSALYATARAYQHVILSPLQITRIAISTLPTLSRSLPNDGLTVDHMVGVIRHLELEIDLINISGDPAIPIQAYVYAYLRAGIPLLLSFDFEPLDGPAQDSKAHAVTVVGYDPGTEGLVALKTGFLLRATAINQLYVHDDRVGPFSPMAFDRSSPGTVVTSWKDADGNKIPAHLDQLLIPLYPQIRTPFAPILAAIMEFDELIDDLRASDVIPLRARLEWDIHPGESGEKATVRSGWRGSRHPSRQPCA